LLWILVYTSSIHNLLGPSWTVLELPRYFLSQDGGQYVDDRVPIAIFPFPSPDFCATPEKKKKKKKLQRSTVLWWDGIQWNQHDNYFFPSDGEYICVTLLPPSGRFCLDFLKNDLISVRTELSKNLNGA
jgi:hypothetical protein